MASQSDLLASRGLHRASGRDGLLIAFAAAHAALLLAAPILPVIALGVWWNSNTISHNFIHHPFFRRRGANLLFAAGLSLLLGIPQSLWRDRHLAHHAGVPPRVRFSIELCAQTALIFALWAALAFREPAYFLTVYAPGYLLGLALCALHGYHEHAHGVTSYYGKLYNAMFFNDGYHAEHHANPAVHWMHLPNRYDPTARPSAWPAPLRWIEACNLDTPDVLSSTCGFCKGSFCGRTSGRCELCSNPPERSARRVSASSAADSFRGPHLFCELCCLGHSLRSSMPTVKTSIVPATSWAGRKLNSVTNATPAVATSTSLSCRWLSGAIARPSARGRLFAG